MGSTLCHCTTKKWIIPVRVFHYKGIYFICYCRNKSFITANALPNVVGH